MALFNKLRQSKTEAPARTGWENMDERAASAAQTEIVDARAEQNRRRQHDKLVQILKGDTPATEKIAGEPEPAGPHDEDIVLAKIAYGKIESSDFEEVLNNIRGPLTDREGNFVPAAGERALGRISQDAHQLKILQYAIDGSNDFRDTSLADLESAIETFENPMQFEAKMEPFMTYLAAHNSPKKVDEYNKALADLDKNLFGKKFEYYERMKELASSSEKIFGKPEKSPLVPSAVPEVKKSGARDSEREKSHEQLIKAGSFYQISRAQARGGQLAQYYGEKLPEDLNCEDSSFIDLDHNFIGVFDGAGGHEGGRRASHIGSDTMADLLKTYGEPKTPDDLSNWLDEAGSRVARDPAAGYSTATLAKVINRQDGGKAVIYAQVGDSRLYIVHPNGRAELVTHDEGFENKITNALGFDQDKTCRQAGYRELQPGDKLMLCSDGITGDKGSDLMSEDEVGATVAGVDTAYAAQALVHQARKFDDRTAIVVEV